MSAKILYNLKESATQQRRAEVTFFSTGTGPSEKGRKCRSSQWNHLKASVQLVQSNNSVKSISTHIEIIKNISQSKKVSITTHCIISIIAFCFQTDNDLISNFICFFCSGKSSSWTFSWTLHQKACRAKRFYKTETKSSRKSNKIQTEHISKEIKNVTLKYTPLESHIKMERKV